MHDDATRISQYRIASTSGNLLKKSCQYINPKSFRLLLSLYCSFPKSAPFQTFHFYYYQSLLLNIKFYQTTTLLLQLALATLLHQHANRMLSIKFQHASHATLLKFSYKSYNHTTSSVEQHASSYFSCTASCDRIILMLQ